MSSIAPPSIARWIRTPGYVILGISLALPLIELFASVLPMRPSVVTWRFAVEGTLSGAIAAPILVLLMIFALAAYCGDRKIMMAVGILCVILAAILLTSAGSFTLDALQMKRRVAPTNLQRFTTGIVMGFIKLSLYGIASVVLAIAAYRARTIKIAEPADTRKNPASGLVVGRPAGSRPSVSASGLISSNASSVSRDVAVIPEAPAEPAHLEDSPLADRTEPSA